MVASMKNPYDGGFKTLAEVYPELLLRMLGILNSGTKPRLIDIVRELQLDPVIIDHGYRIGEGEDSRIAHFEAFSKWHARKIGTLSLYNFLLKYKNKVPVDSYAVFMAEKYAPKRFPKRLIYRDRDGQTIATPYKIIKLWEIDSAIAFEPECRPLLEWVPLLKGGAAEMERAGRIIEELSERPAEAPYSPLLMARNLAIYASLRLR